jgi:GT2 family glycosyltransferase
VTPAWVAVVVLNWNNEADSLECLSSLALSRPRVDAILVDNGSTDGSAEVLAGSGLATHVLRTGKNLGYAGGINQGVDFALAHGYEYVVVLNNDTVVPPETIGRLVAHLAAQGAPAAISPRIMYADEPASMWFGGGIVDRGWPRHLQSSELRASLDVVRESEILSGCCIVASRASWIQAGPLDPSFFLIFEDSDWSLRAVTAGLRLLVADDCLLHHKVSRSFRDGPLPLLGTFYFVRNGLLFHWRHARQDVGHFIVGWVLRPTARVALRRRSDPSLVFAWLGLALAVLGRFGKAPARVERMALRRLSRSRVSQAGG